MTRRVQQMWLVNIDFVFCVYSKNQKTNKYITFPFLMISNRLLNIWPLLPLHRYKQVRHMAMEGGVVSSIEEMKFTLFTGRCEVQDCLGIIKARGMCVKHYRRWQRTGSVDLREPSQEVRTCGVAQCGGSLYAKGLCQAHYQKKRNKELLDARDKLNGY